MKEIDINIEGYNVNGICVGCLNYNRKMFYNKEIKECFRILANIDIPDGLSVQVCWECLAAVRRVRMFRTQIQDAYNILINYSRQHTFLNSPSDFTKHSTTRLTTYSAIHSYPNDKADIVHAEVKEETEDAIQKTEDDIKEEENEFTQQDFSFSDELGHEQDASSEDDVQLSELKYKKELSQEDNKLEYFQLNVPKSSKKMKNLPEELVELYMMTEQEMWVVRAQDQQSKPFSIQRYKCANCLISFNSEKLMSDHKKKHRVKGKDSFQCDVCQAYYGTKDRLSNHRMLHSFAYKCKVCEVITSLKVVISDHIKQHQEVDLTAVKEEEYRCKKCDKVFSTKPKLLYHKSKYHREKLQCDCCGKVFASKMTLRYHLRTTSPDKPEKPKEKLSIPCKGCNKVFNTKKSYTAHVVIHNGITYPCPICGKLFQWKRNLARHTRNHRERDAGAYYECRECNKSFSSRESYNNHMRLSKKHVPEDAYVHECSYCNKKFATKWCMVDHIDWEHYKVIKYQCSAFKTSKILVAHMNNIHEGKKSKEPDGEHLCDICGKSYKTVKRLKGHVWAMHKNRSPNKNYKCKLCPATFAWQTSIYKHMKMMHDSKRNKQSRNIQPVKKQDSYSNMEMETARIHYFEATQLAQGIITPQAAHV
ncbi:hypothetical protein ACJJTC_008670 [Scirpophaga incertulas]